MDVFLPIPPLFYQDNVQDDALFALDTYGKAPTKKDAVVAKAVVGTLADWYRYRGMEARVDAYRERCIGESVIMKARLPAGGHWPGIGAGTSGSLP